MLLYFTEGCCRHSEIYLSIVVETREHSYVAYSGQSDSVHREGEDDGTETDDHVSSEMFILKAGIIHS